MPKGYVTIPVGYKRIDNLPLEANTLFLSLSDAQDYVNNNLTAYQGQLLSIVDGQRTHLYQIGYNKRLILLATEYDKYIPDPEDSPYIINHDLNTYPHIRVVNSDGSLVTAKVKYIDLNTVEVDWNGKFYGFILLN